MRAIVRILLLVCLVTSCSLSWAQRSLTSLRGTVTDPTGAVVPGATITLEDKEKGVTLSKTADESGDYQFQQIQPGKYTITAKATGFGEQTKIAELLVNQPATVSFKLTIESATQTIDVSAEAQTLNTTDASMGNSMNNALIEALPAEGRNVPDLLSL